MFQNASRRTVGPGREAFFAWKKRKTPAFLLCYLSVYYDKYYLIFFLKNVFGVSGIGFLFYFTSS